MAEHLRDGVDESTLIVLPGVGHVCILEALQRLNDLLSAWLTEHN